jgi:hypothetical protein
MFVRFTLLPAPKTGALLLLATLLVPLSAQADRAADAARAEALFDDGRRLMIAHDYDSACPKLAESQRLDPAPGTLLNLAVCYERANKTATAWATYKSAALAAQRAGEADRATAASTKANDLEPRLSRITFTVAPVAGLEVRCDGQPVREPSWGVALPYDPGDHDVEAIAPGRRPWSLRLRVSGDGQTLAVKIPELAPLPVAAAPAAATAPVERDDKPQTATSGTFQRVIGGVTAAIGLGGIGVGTYAGLHAKSQYDVALSECGGGTVCPDGHGPATRNDAGNWATGSTIAFIAGGVVAAGGALLFFTAPRSKVTVGLGPAAQGSGLSLAGVF